MPLAAQAQRPIRRAGAPAEPGSNGRGHVQAGDYAQVGDIQRARILSAMFDVVAERGAGNVTVAHVVERSGVSRRTFYESFGDCDACFLAAFEKAVGYASERVLPAYHAGGRWRERVRRSLVALLLFLGEEPVIGRLLISDSLAAGAVTLERRGDVLAQITRAVDLGGKESGTGAALPSLAAEGIVGGVFSILHTRMIAGERGSLMELVNPLMSMIVMPYLGASAARRELARPVPVSARPHESLALLADPFKDAGMRLTYRTVRVLMAIADSPQASNRAIGEEAGVSDQGQISKLLARLEHIELICNSGLGPGQGAPNAWSLTPTGEQVVHNIRTIPRKRLIPGT